MKHPDDIDILYFLDRHGWSTCYLYVYGSIYVMEPTHIFNDPIEELLSALTTILSGEDEVDFKWYDEPGVYNWRIKRNLEQQHKVIITVDNCYRLANEPVQESEVIEFEVKLKLFCICVINQMSKIRDLMTETSYKEDRKFPFLLFKEFSKAYRNAFNYVPE